MKRSSQVALLLMGVTGVGATGYAMTRPPPNCIPHGSPAAVAPAMPGAAAAEACPPRRSWTTSSGYSRSSWTRTNSSSKSSSAWPVFSRTGTSAAPSTSVPLSARTSTSSTPSRSTTTTTTTTRSGFGSTASSVSRSSGS